MSFQKLTPIRGFTVLGVPTQPPPILLGPPTPQRHLAEDRCGVENR
jgi:hypothetical protein